MRILKTVTGKVLLATMGGVLLSMALGLAYSHFKSKALIEDFALREARQEADTLFDNLNKLMLTGQIGDRQTLIDEFSKRDNIASVHVSRSPALNEQYGPGNGQEQARDELERQALAGEAINIINAGENGRTLTLIHPYRATEDTRGVNCLGCHAVPSGTVLGAIRIEYDLNAYDSEIREQGMMGVLIYLSLFLAGSLLIAQVLKRLLSKPLDHMRSIMMRIEAESNLTLRSGCIRDDELGQVAATFDTMLDRFEKLISEVLASISLLGSTTDQLRLASDLTRMGVDRQLADTAQLTEAMGTMSERVRNVSTHATQTTDAAIKAHREALSGVEQSLEAMDAIQMMVNELSQATGVIEHLNHEGRNIGAVVGLIREIADQTNLLALNAAIEAARAGEAGRGFAVVADEVRTLAQRTRQATEEIQRIVGMIQNGAEQAVDAIGRASAKTEVGVAQVERNVNSLNTIAVAISVISEMSREILSATEVQAISAQEVSNNVVNINQATEQTVSVAKQTNSASENVNVVASQLRELASRFSTSAASATVSDGAVTPVATPTQASDDTGDITLF